MLLQFKYFLLSGNSEAKFLEVITYAFLKRINLAGNKHYKYAHYYKGIRVIGVEEYAHEPLPDTENYSEEQNYILK
ncbi:MAG TPA: hypothetical protein VFM99_05725 [Chitinophagales bacterium]|nr:hypothetical protein [Chitinophagales bacterium]